MKITDANVTIMISEMDTSIDFYLMLGLKLKKRWESHYAMLEAPGVVIGLHPGGPAGPTEHVTIGFIIEDINEAKRLLEENRIEYRYAEGDSGMYVHFTDPDGTMLYFNQPAWSYND